MSEVIDPTFYRTPGEVYRAGTGGALTGGGP